MAPVRRIHIVGALTLGLVVFGCVPRERPGGDRSKNGHLAPKSATPASEKPRSDRGAAKPSNETSDPLLEAPFSDDFDRSSLGPSWRTTSSGVWKIVEGQLCGEGAKNHPVWLTRRLPVNARIEFDATSYSDDGDLKVEIWGDGRSAASGVSYDDATSYLTILGGWKNHFHVLARIDEHARDRKQIRVDPSAESLPSGPVVPTTAYRFKIERNDGRTVRWYVDGGELLTYPDDEPLRGPGHEYFGYNDWQVRVCFDNLKITPLPDTP